MTYSRNNNSIATLAGPVTGTSPCSQRRTVRSPFGPRRNRSANPLCERPRTLRAALTSAGFNFDPDAPQTFTRRQAHLQRPLGFYVLCSGLAHAADFAGRSVVPMPHNTKRGGCNDLFDVHFILPHQVGHWPGSLHMRTLCPVVKCGYANG